MRWSSNLNKCESQIFGLAIRGFDRMRTSQSKEFFKKMPAEKLGETCMKIESSGIESQFR